MTTYLILLPGDEAAWEAATPEQRAAVFAEHDRFSRTLEERGHSFTGGAESGDLDDLAAVCGILATTGEPVEIRPCLDGPGE